MRDQLDTAHRRLLIVVAVLCAATAAAVVLLWPDAGIGGDEAGGGPLYAGEITGLEERSGDANSDVGLPEAFLRLDVEVLEGPDAGERVAVEVPREGFPRVEVGDAVEVERTASPDGGHGYHIADFQRLPTVLWLAGLFVVTVLAISRWHGLRSLIGLGISLLIIVRFVVPSILSGNSPPLVALVGAVAVMIVTLYLTHGLKPMTTAAVVGTSGSLAATVALGTFFVDRARITGFASEDAVFARFAVDGALDLQGLVLAGLIIAALGVLDDVTISQASTVFALHDADTSLSWSELFARAMVVGRDHIASVVNTLFLAYAGASLALLVLFSTGGRAVAEILNSEVLAEEIVKTLVGSLGLILAVPFTTALAASLAVGRRADGRRGPGGGAAPPPGPAPTDEVDGAGEGDRELDDEERAARAWAAYLRATATQRDDDDTDD